MDAITAIDTVVANFLVAINVHAILLLIQYPRWDIINGVFFLRVTCSKDVVPEAPIESVVASTVVVMFNMIVQVKCSGIMRQQSINTCQETYC